MRNGYKHYTTAAVHICRALPYNGFWGSHGSPTSIGLVVAREAKPLNLLQVKFGLVIRFHTLLKYIILLFIQPKLSRQRQSRRKGPHPSRPGGLTYAQGPHATCDKNF